MPDKRLKLINGEFYHIVQRGIEERDIFLDDEDRLRFINSLLVFNDENPTPWFTRSFWVQRGTTSLRDYFPGKPLVEIHSFVLMNNHFHILLRQILGNGISTFLKKLGGYVYYFNKKYKRVGPLFQGRFKSILIKDDIQIRTIFNYIHCNPLSIIEPIWKESGVKDLQKACQFLEEYKWSSFLDFIGKENFPNVIKKDFFQELLNVDFKQEIKSWILYKSGLTELKSNFLE